MTGGSVDLARLRGSLQSLSRGDLLAIAMRAIELVPGATLPALLGETVIEQAIELAAIDTGVPLDLGDRGVGRVQRDGSLRAVKLGRCLSLAVRWRRMPATRPDPAQELLVGDS